MYTKTRGIVLQSTKFSENSLIVKMYTEERGRHSFMVRLSKGKNARMRLGIFQPLNILEMVVPEKNLNKITYIKEVVSVHQYTDIPYNIFKSSIAIFIAEILNKVIREEEQNTDMFQFIIEALLALDHFSDKSPDFHLVFLLNLSKYLGFEPHQNYSEHMKYFNLYEGHFQSAQPEHQFFIEGEMSRNFNLLMQQNCMNIVPIGLNNNTRKELLQKILDLFSIHLNNFGKVKSLSVLEEVFH